MKIRDIMNYKEVNIKYSQNIKCPECSKRKQDKSTRCTFCSGTGRSYDNKLCVYCNGVGYKLDTACK
jgi:hypothetical protein